MGRIKGEDGELVFPILGEMSFRQIAQKKPDSKVFSVCRFGHSLVSDVFEGKNQPWRLGKFFGDPQFAVAENQTNHGAENELEGKAFCLCHFIHFQGK